MSLIAKAGDLELYRKVLLASVVYLPVLYGLMLIDR